MTEPKKPEPKKPEEKLPNPYVSALGPVPPEHFDNDQRFTGEEFDRGPGSIYDALDKRQKAKP